MTLYKYGKISRGLELYPRKNDGRVEKDPYKVATIYLKSSYDSAVVQVDEYELGTGILWTGSRAIQNIEGKEIIVGLDNIVENSKNWVVKIDEDSEDKDSDDSNDKDATSGLE